MSKQKIEELIPDLIRQISKGEGVSVKDIAKKHNVSADGIKKRLREVKDRFYKKYFNYDGSSRKWVVKSEYIGFLQKEILEPEEAVALTAIYRNRTSFGKNLAPTFKKIVKNYTKRAKSYIFKQHISEEITEDMEKNFALLKNAINNKRVIELEYNNKLRTIYPYRIVYIEYYWYLICSENNRIKSFRVSLMKNLNILTDTYEYDFSNVDKRLKLVMNAFVDYQEPFKYIHVFVWEKIVNHVDIASYFNAWKKLDEIIVVNGKKFQRFEVTTTNPNFDDITPTILKYMPNIIVSEPQELINKIVKITKEYQSIYSP